MQIDHHLQKFLPSFLSFSFFVVFVYFACSVAIRNTREHLAFLCCLSLLPLFCCHNTQRILGVCYFTAFGFSLHCSNTWRFFVSIISLFALLLYNVAFLCFLCLFVCIVVLTSGEHIALICCLSLLPLICWSNTCRFFFP